MRELSLNVLDIVQNSITAGSELTTIEVDEQGKWLTISISDTGCGMSEEMVASVTDPFCTTRKTRKVGLGIPLFKLAAEQTGGSLSIKSRLGEGTVISARFDASSIDMTPLGDINSTISIIIRMNPSLDFIFIRRKDSEQFTLDTRELRQVLEDVPLDSPEVLEWIEAFLGENTAELLGGVN